MRVPFRKVEESSGVMWTKIGTGEENRFIARRFVFYINNYFLQGTECVKVERDRLAFSNSICCMTGVHIWTSQTPLLILFSS